MTISAPAATDAETPTTQGDPLRLAVIVASVRDGRFGPTVASWFARHAGQHGDFEVEVADLANVVHPLNQAFTGADPSPTDAGALTALTATLDRADAYVIVTPEYNHSYPASLKNAIDAHRQQWFAKPVGFVSYGGQTGGLLAVESLRLVFAELHAVTIRDTVTFPHVWQRFDENGGPHDTSGSDLAAATLLERVAWWAHALRDARAVRPYRG